MPLREEKNVGQETCVCFRPSFSGPAHLSSHLCCVGALDLDMGLGSAVSLPRCSLLLLQFLVWDAEHWYDLANHRFQDFCLSYLLMKI